MSAEIWPKEYNDERVVNYEPLPSGNFFLNYKSVPGFAKLKEVEKSMPSQLGTFVLSNMKRFMKTFVIEKGGFSPDIIKIRTHNLSIWILIRN